MDPLTDTKFLLLLLLSSIGSCAGQDQDILPEGPVDATVGKDVTLKTILDKVTFNVLIWNFNDGEEQINVVSFSGGTVKVNAAYQGRVSFNQTNGYLTIRTLKPEDSGDYSITVITADVQTLTAEIKLRVLEPVSDVVVKSDVTEAIEHNSTVVLTCTAKGSFLKFIWSKGANPITVDGIRLTVKEGEMSSALTVRGVLRSDFATPIFCTASNSLEKKKSAPFNLTVHYGPEEVNLSPSSVPSFIRAGSNFSLSCSALSSPPAVFSWYHDEQPLEVTGPVLTLKDIEGKSLGKKTEEYTCRAKNAKTLRNIVSQGVSFAVREAIVGTKITGPTAMLIAGNSSANLSCRATAGAAESTMWMKNDKTLAGSDRVVFSPDMSSMMIKVVTKDDNGEYKCLLKNAVNTDQASFKMVVNYGPEDVQVMGRNEVEVKDLVTLICKVASVPPANYTWKLNNTLTTATTDTFVIAAATYKDTGMYTCVAHNAVTGKSSSNSFNLSVKEEGALDEGLSDGAIAGIVIGILAALALAIGLIFYCRQKVPVESPY